MAIAESTSGHVIPAPDTASTQEGLTDLLTVQEAAQCLKVTVSWVYEHVDLRPRIGCPSSNWASTCDSTHAISAPISMPNATRRDTPAADVDASALPR